jgi:hypothetical protein
MQLLLLKRRDLIGEKIKANGLRRPTAEAGLGGTAD